MSIKSIKTDSTPFKRDDLPDSDIEKWLETLQPDMTRLLAHAYAGVIWGRRDEEHGWQFSSGRVETSPPLEIDTLMHLRVFGEHGEVFLWRDGADWRAREVRDGAGDEKDVMDEAQILWGTYGESIEGGFTRLEDGNQGLVHAVPVGIPRDAFGDLYRPARLYLRHYLKRHEPTGLAYIEYSRLTGVDCERQTKE